MEILLKSICHAVQFQSNNNRISWITCQIDSQFRDILEVSWAFLLGTKTGAMLSKNVISFPMVKGTSLTIGYTNEALELTGLRPLVRMIRQFLKEKVTRGGFLFQIYKGNIMPTMAS